MECKDSPDGLLSKNFPKTFSSGHLRTNLSIGITFFGLTDHLFKFMDENNFHSLCLEDRAKMLWKKGNFVESITYFNYCLMLYSIDRQFVELFYDKNSRRIVWINLANEHDMMKYLNNIRIPA